MANARPAIPEAQLGPAERLLDLVLSSSAHLWHNRPGIEVNGLWQMKTSSKARYSSTKQ
jgi:hypothetical protein